MPDAEPPTTVLLLGWMGAQTKHVKKYQDMYSKADGIITMQAIADPTDVMMYRHDGLLQCGLRALMTLVEKSPVGPIVVHTFSNGGNFVWNLLVRLMHGQDAALPSVTTEQLACLKQVQERLVGEIFDSAPCYMYISSGMAAIDASFSRNAAFRVLFKTAFVTSGFFGALWSMASGQLTAPALYWSRCKDWPTTTKQLYVYSDVDALCDVAALEEHIAAMEAKGIAVTTLHFEDSPHVLHLKKYPVEYAEACFRFCGVPSKL